MEHGCHIEKPLNVKSVYISIYRPIATKFVGMTHIDTLTPTAVKISNLDKFKVAYSRPISVLRTVNSS